MADKEPVAEKLPSISKPLASRISDSALSRQLRETYRLITSNQLWIASSVIFLALIRAITRVSCCCFAAGKT